MCDNNTDNKNQRRKSRRSFVPDPCDLPDDEAIGLENMDVDRVEEDIKVRVRRAMKKYKIGLKCLKRNQLHEVTNSVVEMDANDDNLNLEYRDLTMQVQNAVEKSKQIMKTVEELQNYCKVVEFKIRYCKRQKELLDNVKTEHFLTERINIFNSESHLPTFFDE